VEDALEALLLALTPRLRGVRDDGVVDVQPRAVARQAAVEFALHLCGEVTAVVRRREQHVPRFVVVAPRRVTGVRFRVEFTAGASHRGEQLRVRLVPEPFQFGVVLVDDHVGAARDGLVGQVTDLVLEQHGDDSLVVPVVVLLVVAVHQASRLPEHLS